MKTIPLLLLLTLTGCNPKRTEYPYNEIPISNITVYTAINCPHCKQKNVCEVQQDGSIKHTCEKCNKEYTQKDWRKPDTETNTTPEAE